MKSPQLDSGLEPFMVRVFLFFFNLDDAGDVKFMSWF